MISSQGMAALLGQTSRPAGSSVVPIVRLLVGLLVGLLATTFLRTWWPTVPSVTGVCPLLLRVGLRVPDWLTGGTDTLLRVVWSHAVFLLGGAVAAFVAGSRTPSSGARVGAGVGVLAMVWVVLLLLLATFVGQLAFPWRIWAARAVLHPMFQIGLGALGGVLAGSMVRFGAIVVRRTRSSI